MCLNSNKTKLWISLVPLLILCIFSLTLTFTFKTTASSGLVVVIDAGHGGSDGGVKGVKSGISEAELNLKVSYTLKSMFEERGAKVVLTRTDNVIFPDGKGSKKEDFNNRKELILNTKPDIVISIHQNKFPDKSRRGAQVFFNNNDAKGIALARAVQDKLNKINEVEVGRKFSALKGDYYILNCSNYPSCIVECGFLSNPLDDELLNSEEYQKRLAEAILEGAYSYFSESNL